MSSTGLIHINSIRCLFYFSYISGVNKNNVSSSEILVKKCACMTNKLTNKNNVIVTSVNINSNTS